MTTPRTIDSYGGKKIDLGVVEVPEGEMSSGEDNRRSEDLAQLTQIPLKAWVRWITSTTAAPTTVASGNVSGGSQFGLGSAQLPVVTKTGTGLYTVTYPATWTDGLQVEESIVFTHGAPSIEGSTLGKMQIQTFASNVVTVKIWDSSNVPSDLGGAGIACLHLG